MLVSSVMHRVPLHVLLTAPLISCVQSCSGRTCGSVEPTQSDISRVSLHNNKGRGITGETVARPFIVSGERLKVAQKAIGGAGSRSSRPWLFTTLCFGGRRGCVQFCLEVALGHPMRTRDVCVCHCACMCKFVHRYDDTIILTLPEVW